MGSYQSGYKYGYTYNLTQTSKQGFCERGLKF